MSAGGAQTAITSTPYLGLRNYGGKSQLEQEFSVEEYVEALDGLFMAVYRVLIGDDVMWFNLGDIYASRLSGSPVHLREPMLGVPWRVAFALQDSGKDRLASTHEHVFLFSKAPKYYFNLDAIREPHRSPRKARSSGGPHSMRGQSSLSKRGPNSGRYHLAGKNPGDVWTIPTKGYEGDHSATFPPNLVHRAILAGSRVGDTVLDPFSGSATTGMVATQLGRRCIGVNNDALQRD